MVRPAFLPGSLPSLSETTPVSLSNDPPRRGGRGPYLSETLLFHSRMIRTVAGGGGPARGQTGVSQRGQAGFQRRGGGYPAGHFSESRPVLFGKLPFAREPGPRPPRRCGSYESETGVFQIRHADRWTCFNDNWRQNASALLSRWCDPVMGGSPPGSAGVPPAQILPQLRPISSTGINRQRRPASALAGPMRFPPAGRSAATSQGN